MKLAIGSAQFGLDYGLTNHNGIVGLGEVKKILAISKEKKINLIDTSTNYGISENILGQADVLDFDIITKTRSIDHGVDDVINNFFISLKKLKLRKVKGLLIHNIKDINHKDFKKLFYHLVALKKDGFFDQIGFSVYSPSEVDFILDNYDFDIVQLPFNVFDTRLLQGGQLDSLKEKNIEIHARSIFLQGLLINPNNNEGYFRKWSKDFLKYQNLVEKSGYSLMSYALSYVANNNQIDRIIVGITSGRQLEEVIDSIRIGQDLKPYPILDEDLLNPALWSL